MTFARRHRERHHDERGITLPELLVSCALLVLVLPLAGSLLHGAVLTQRDVQSVVAATTAVQTVTGAVELGVRNASAMRHVARPDGTELLVVRSLVGPPGQGRWVCQGWYYQGGAVYMRRVGAAGASTPAIVAPSDADIGHWTVLATGVTPRDDGVDDQPDTLFTPVPPARTTRVDVDILASAGARPPVAISTTFVARPQGQTGSAPCF